MHGISWPDEWLPAFQETPSTVEAFNNLSQNRRASFKIPNAPLNVRRMYRCVNLLCYKATPGVPFVSIPNINMCDTYLLSSTNFFRLHTVLMCRSICRTKNFLLELLLETDAFKGQLKRLTYFVEDGLTGSLTDRFLGYIIPLLQLRKLCYVELNVSVVVNGVVIWI
jgi:hypothetical protein